MVETEFTEFTEEETKAFRENFLTYDLDKNGILEVFELHQMFESVGDTKTNAELLQIIKEADQTAKGGIDYREYLSILVKYKKGQLHSSLWGDFVKIAKQHDTSKETGKKANVFEQKAAELANEQQQEAKIKAQAAKRKQLQTEEKEAARKEKERKEKVAAGLAKLKANINK